MMEKKYSIVIALNVSTKWMLILSTQQAPIKSLQETMEIGLANFFNMTDIPLILRHPHNPETEDNLFVELAKCLVGQSKYTFAALFFCILLRTHGFIPESKKSHYIEKSDELKKQLIVCC